MYKVHHTAPSTDWVAIKKMPRSLLAPREKATQEEGTTCMNPGRVRSFSFLIYKTFSMRGRTSGPVGTGRPRELGGPKAHGRVPKDEVSPLPQTALHTLLTSVKLLALRVNVFYIKNILK